MGRWDILQRDNARDSEARTSTRRTRDRSQAARTFPLVEGRQTFFARTHRKDRSGRGKAPQSGRQIAGPSIGDRGRTYSLRSSEIAAMTDIGTFRTVDVQRPGSIRLWRG